MRVRVVCILLAATAAGLYLSSPAPAQAQDSGFFVSADWLNWKARRRDMDFVIVDPNTDTDVQGNQIDLNYDRNSGARVVLGYRLGSCWELAAEYQHFDTNDRLLVTQPTDGRLWATRIHPDSVIGSHAATSAEGRATLNYDVIDFVISRKFEMDCCSRVHFTLFGGFRYAMVDQTLNINYVDSVNSRSAVINDEIKLDGYGIRAGGHLKWNLFGGLSVFGQGGISVLAARANAHYTEIDHNGESTTDLVDVTETYYQAVPVIETALGVAYRKGSWEVSGGYEMALWGNVGERRDYSDDIEDQKFTYPSSDLILDGFFVRLAYNR